MTQALINNFEYILKARRCVVVSLFAVAVALVGTYGYFMAKTVANTVALQSVQAALTKENQTVSSLSGRYVALSGQATMAAALADGFSAATVSTFVTVPTESQALTINAF